jgi:hypothetical protein
MPDFSWYNIPKRRKYTKWPQNIPNYRKIDQKAIKYTTNFQRKTLQNLPKVQFLFLKQTIWQPCSKRMPEDDRTDDTNKKTLKKFKSKSKEVFFVRVQIS